MKEIVDKTEATYRWEKIFANDVIDKELISIYINSSYYSISKKKSTEELNRHFSKEEMHMCKRHMKIHSLIF